LAIGDIIGSNLTNITLVLGLMLMGTPFAVDITVLIEILPFLLVTTIIFWRFLSRGGVTKYGGVILLKLHIIPSFANLTRLDVHLHKPKRKGILVRFEFSCTLASFKN